MLKEQRSPDRTFESNPERDREVARTCLGRLTPDCSRDDWIKVGMALHSLGEDMLELWHDWSSGGATYNRREADRQWNSFEPGKVNLGTLIHMAGLTKDELRGIGGGSSQGVGLDIRRQTQKTSAPMSNPRTHPTPDRPFFTTLDEAVKTHTPKGFVEAKRWRWSDDHYTVRFNRISDKDDDSGSVKEKRVLPFSVRVSGMGIWRCEGPEHRTLYRQDQLPEDADELVLVLEGEKCADIAAGLGFAAVTSGSSTSAARTDWSALAGRRVVVIPDFGPDGMKYAEAVREQVQAHGCEVSIVELPELTRIGHDIEQWVDLKGDGAVEALKELLAKSDQTPMPDMRERLDRVVDDLDRTQGQKYVGLPCGLPQLDKMLDGFRGLIVMSGAPGCGKTNLALQAAAGVVDLNPSAAVLFVTLEMSPDELLRRLICQFDESSSLDWHALVKGTGIDQYQRARAILNAQGKMTDILPRLQMIGQTDLERLMQRGDSVTALLRAVRALKRKTGAKRCMVVIDNFAHLPMPHEDISDLELEREKIAKLLRFQEQLGEAVLVIAQQSKEAIKSSEDGMVAVKGAVEQIYAADAVLNLTKSKREALQDPRVNGNGLPKLIDRNGEPLPVVQLTMPKGRDGMHRRSIFMLFDHEHFQLVELDASQVSSASEGNG